MSILAPGIVDQPIAAHEKESNASLSRAVGNMCASKKSGAAGGAANRDQFGSMPNAITSNALSHRVEATTAVRPVDADLTNILATADGGSYVSLALHLSVTVDE